VGSRTLTGAILLLCLSQALSAGERWWVRFSQKPVVHSAALVSERSLARRSKVLPPDRLTDEADLPVDASYILAVRQTGARVRAVSRILNAISVEADDASMRDIRRLPFVADVTPVRSGRRAPDPVLSDGPRFLSKTAGTTSLDYGPSITHHQSLHSIPLHELGVIGHGVLVGMVDDGFNSYRTHDALRSINVLAAYDFVQGDTTVSIIPGEDPIQGFHGAATLSVLGGYDPGTLIGPAFGATFALAKTEVDGSETIIEEDYYVQGLEWLDSIGVDIISSSLVYLDWYTYADLNGQTAITTKVAKTLASRGILLVTAMGNEGNYRTGTSTTGTLGVPADADDILAAGAVSPSGALTSFSSTGPTADGRIKPDVVAQGSQNFVADWTNTSGYYYSQGTSFATPLTAAAAALVLSAHPEITALQLRAALKNSAKRIDDHTSRTTTYPNNFYGWGQVDAYAAALSLGPIVSNIPIVKQVIIGVQPTLVVTVRAASAAQLDMSRFALFAKRSTESSFTRYPFSPGSEAGMFTVQLAMTGAADTNFTGYVTVADELGPEYRHPMGAGVVDLRPTPATVAERYPPGDNGGIPTTFELEQNYPNPFNPGTTFLVRAPVAGHVDLTVYNLLGQHVATVFSGTVLPGPTSISWPRALDNGGRDLPTGVYIFRLSTPDGQRTRKMVLVK